jgi:hypothetical protein
MMPGTCIAIACLQQVAALFNNVLRAQLLGPAAFAGTDVPRAYYYYYYAPGLPFLAGSIARTDLNCPLLE